MTCHANPRVTGNGRCRECIELEPSTPGAALGIRTIAELQADEDAAAPASWLVEPIVMSDDYGTVAAKAKAGKTWLLSDLAVSIATGTPFVANYATTEGNVVFFAGEGGRRRILRRLDAIARARGLDLGALDRLRVSLRAPVVRDEQVRADLAAELEARPAALVLIEPFYLAGRGVGRGQLNEIGEVLGAAQEVAQDAGAALLFSDHWNKSGTGIGAERITGAGMHEWARVLVNGLVEDSRLDVVGRATSVDLRWDVSGEIPDVGFRIRRSVRAIDPDDPASKLIYEITFLGEIDPTTTRTLSEDATKLLFEVRARRATEARPAKSNDVRATVGVPKQRATDAWAELEAAGKIDRTLTRGAAFDVWLIDEDAP